MKREVSEATRRWSADQLRSRPHLAAKRSSSLCATFAISLNCSRPQSLVRWCPAPENPGQAQYSTALILNEIDIMAGDQHCRTEIFKLMKKAITWRDK